MWSQSRGSFAMKDLVIGLEKKAASLSFGLNIIYFFTFGPRECGGRNTRLFAPFQHPQTFFYSFFFCFLFFYIVITFFSPVRRFRSWDELRRCLTRSTCYSHTIWWHLSGPTAEKCNKHVTDQAVTPSQLANQPHRLRYVRWKILRKLCGFGFPAVLHNKLPQCWNTNINISMHGLIFQRRCCREKK